MWPDERGQSLVEMALVLPLLLLLVLGIIDFGRAFNNYIIITNAAREGARYAARFPLHDVGIRQAAILEAEESGVVLEEGDIAIEGLGAPGGEPIRVVVTYDFDTILGQLVGVGSIALQTSTEMVVFGFVME